MGLLDQVIGGVVGQVLGGGRGGSGSTMSPVVKALLMLLVAKGMSGGLGEIFGGGSGSQPRERRSPAPDSNDGDLGGFGNSRDGGGGEFGDLAGMLDGPGDRSPGAGPYAQLDREEAAPGGGAIGGGLDGLIQSFERSGLGDMIGSWIGQGQNRQIEANRLADALGPDTVDTLSRQTGLNRSDLLGQLSQALPQVIDALTPQGRVPQAHERREW